MPLSDTARERIEAEARRRGDDPAAAVAEAEKRSGAERSGDTDKTPEAGKPKRPVVERLLIGFLPFVKVHELRSIWLGLADRIPDDELTCGEYQLKHGAAPSSEPPTPEVE